MSTYRAAIIGLGRMGSTFDDEITRGGSLAVNCARRWNPMYSEARRIIQEGHLGNVLQITAHAACTLSHNGVHLLDTIRFLAGGDVQWVLGEMESDEAAGSDD